MTVRETYISIPGIRMGPGAYLKLPGPRREQALTLSSSPITITCGRPEEGYHGKVLVIVGCEFNTERNHYPGIDIEQEVAGNDDHPQEVIDGARPGGIGSWPIPLKSGLPFINRGKPTPGPIGRSQAHRDGYLELPLAVADNVSGIAKGSPLF